MGDVADIAAWLAPAATMVAAIMTASNGGARLTGWGFVVFTVGSIAWATVALATKQPNLLLTNSFLTLVNIVGVWRWLGRQARYEAGAEAAAGESRHKVEPALVPLSSIPGAKILGRSGDEIGVVIDAMLTCQSGRIAYFVVSEGGVGGLGERLHAVPLEAVKISSDGLRCSLSGDDLRSLEIMRPDAWPDNIEAKRGPREG